MLDAFLESVIDQKAGFIVPGQIGEALHMNMEQLARTVGLHRNTMRNPRSPQVQERLAEVAQIISRAAELAEGEGRAVAWFRYQPLPGFSNKTAEALVGEGKAAAVLQYLDELDDGGYV